ncbi:hypothetical protein CA850_29595 [Micromonospora echinospora]|uniref:Uncharacterized protein n=1 Tax=Micromonospora echinospora TaxID=1877 RepID=A0A1C5ABS6_MICEC|nr:hypothetical protein [Micromonospora echinospora]OZV74734.1 hypothetical protein CA850_29595 [Micromonospora echinospora]SCE66688.1 hypothetical protein GA0070618_0015 [Micromonospora echinospora]SCF42599.1 hypothetical protein GA0070618_6685 [Micromonospora echinospora]
MTAIATEAAPALTILGVTDEQTTCDRCGRIELRGTVILGDENGEAGRYGSTCAGYMLDPTGRTKGVGNRARLIEEVRRDRIYWALRSAHAALADRDKRDQYGAAGFTRACRIVTDLERATLIHRPDEIAAVAAVRAKAREIRAELRAAGKL